MIEDITEDMNGESVTPAAHHLFEMAEHEKNYPKTTQTYSTILWHNYYIFQIRHVQTSIQQYPSCALG